MRSWYFSEDVEEHSMEEPWTLSLFEKVADSVHGVYEMTHLYGVESLLPTRLSRDRLEALSRGLFALTAVRNHSEGGVDEEFEAFALSQVLLDASPRPIRGRSPSFTIWLDALQATLEILCSAYAVELARRCLDAPGERTDADLLAALKSVRNTVGV